MSNLDTAPTELLCEEGRRGPGVVQILEPRDVPLGGPRAMPVRRTLPHKQRPLIGAWCFVDHYGPDDVALTGGMRVAPHPHTGLQTVSWLFTGEIEHRDSAGNHAMVRAGELNLMTAGRGISHSELSTPETTILHGAQLWLALPDKDRFTDPGFEHYEPEPVAGPGYEARVFIGSLFGQASPVTTYSALLGAELVLEPGAAVDLPLVPGFEHGVLVDTGSAVFDGAPVARAELAYRPAGAGHARLEAGPDGARVLLLGGEPLREPIVMWWNFIGRSHEEIVEYRANWQAQIGAEPAEGHSVRQFGDVVDNTLPELPAPELPHVRMKPRNIVGEPARGTGGKPDGMTL
jgi:quercetin 2,3-dioxygenase